MIRFVDPSMPKIYGKVGFCIYCGRTDDLRTEHIVPFGLGGNLELPKASCRGCEDITKKFEEQCLRRMYGTFRAKLGIRTRRPRERPTHAVAGIYTNRVSSETSLPLSEQPLCLQMFGFYPPDILLGVEPRDRDLPFGLWSCMRDSGELGGLLAKYGPGNYGFGTELHPMFFARMLAKIAYAFAIAELGSGFSPTLLDTIKNVSPPHAAYYVGGSLTSEPSSSHKHELSITRESHLGRRLINIRIRLFSDLGSPVYYCIAGEYFI